MSTLRPELRPDPGLMVLGREQCLALLGTASAGRVDYTVHGSPQHEEVSFLLDSDGTGAFVRMAAGTRSAAVGRTGSLSLEVARLDPTTGKGWGVLASGRGDWVRDLDEVRRLELHLRCAEPLDRPLFARITFRHISGHFSVSGPGALWPSGRARDEGPGSDMRTLGR